MDPVVAHAKSVIERGSKSFAAASKLFDAKTRERAFLLYAWCRHCDDRIDGQELGFGQRSPEPALQLAILETLTRETRSALAGEAQTDPVFAGLARVYRDCAIPERYPLELLEGFAMDVERRRYRTLEDTLLYCYHVAGVVGAMMACVMGVRDPLVIDRAIDLGIAFQLTNISRDVMEDARDSRVYLPAAWLEEAGAPTDPRVFESHAREIVPVVERLLGEADRYYASARYGIAELPVRSAWAIAAARSIYREIGRNVRARGEAAWSERVGTGAGRKLALLGGSAVTAVAGSLRIRARKVPPRVGLFTAARAGSQLDA